jgi:hypothetical protein
MAEHADGFVRPPPTAPQTLAALEAQGAPASLVALYGQLSHSPAGLLPSGSDKGGCVLRPAEHLFVREVADEWPFGGGPARLVMVREAVYAEDSDGQRTLLGETLEQALERHLQRLVAGALAWDAFAEKLVAAERLPPRGLVPRIVAEATGEPGAFELWTRELAEDLLARGRADLPGLGHLELHTSWETSPMTPRAGGRAPGLTKVLFRPGQMLSARLELPGRSVGRPSRSVQLRGLSLPRGAGQRLAATLLEGLAAELLAQAQVDWPGLGRFRFEPQALGGPLLFRAWPTLRRLLNPAPRGSGT